MGKAMIRPAARLALFMTLAVAAAACAEPPTHRASKRFYYAPDAGGGVWRGNAQTGELQHCTYTAGQDIACVDAPAPKMGKGAAGSATAN
jgi:hypothetical protein